MKLLLLGTALIILGFTFIFDFEYRAFITGTIITFASILLMIIVSAKDTLHRKLALAKKKKPIRPDSKLILYGIGEISMIAAIVGFLDLHFNFITPNTDNMIWIILLPLFLVSGIVFLIWSYRITPETH